jgi:hypothetical protein
MAVAITGWPRYWDTNCASVHRDVVWKFMIISRPVLGIGSMSPSPPFISAVCIGRHGSIAASTRRLAPFHRIRPCSVSSTALVGDGLQPSCKRNALTSWSVRIAYRPEECPRSNARGILTCRASPWSPTMRSTVSGYIRGSICTSFPVSRYVTAWWPMGYCLTVSFPQGSPSLPPLEHPCSRSPCVASMDWTPGYRPFWCWKRISSYRKMHHLPL